MAEQCGICHCRHCGSETCWADVEAGEVFMQKISAERDRYKRALEEILQVGKQAGKHCGMCFSAEGRQEHMESIADRALNEGSEDE